MMSLETLGYAIDPERPDTHVYCTSCGKYYSNDRLAYMKRHRDVCELQIRGNPISPVELESERLKLAGFEIDRSRPKTHVRCAACGKKYQRNQRAAMGRHRLQCDLRDKAERSMYYQLYGPRDLAEIEQRGSFLIEVRSPFGFTRDDRDPIVSAIKRHFGETFVSCALTPEGGAVVLKHSNRKEVLHFTFGEALRVQAARFAKTGDMKTGRFKVFVGESRERARQTKLFTVSVADDTHVTGLRTFFFETMGEQEKQVKNLEKKGKMIKRDVIEIPSGLAFKKALVWVARRVYPD